MKKKTSPRRHLLGLSSALAALTLLASCGGGDPEPARSADGGERKQATVFTPTTPIPSNANVAGMWSGVTPWPIIPVHAVVLPDGRVMSYGTRPNGQQTAFFEYDVWDPVQGLAAGHTTIPNGTATDIFCSSQVVLPDGSAVFIAGGDNWTGSGTTNTGNRNSNLFSTGSNSLARGNDMNRPRWYSGSTVLLNGEIYIQGGSSGTDRPEVRQTNGTFRLLSGANTSSFDFMYPRNFVAPDGRVFGYDSAGRMYYVNTTGTGSLVSAGSFTGSYAGNDASAAMFRPGRILQFGGNSNGAIVIDIRGGSPTWTPTQSMSTQRRLVTGTILADGKVLATGGSRTWNQLDQVNNTAEIWNPDTGTWTLGATAVRARLYHSMALLLPDATVIVGGGGAPGPQNNTNFELYFPPYLFGPNGTLAPRPVIETAPTVMDIGHTYSVDMAAGGPAPARVVMVKTGSVTHSWNMDQRFVELTYVANGNRLAIQAPTRAADAPPGFYMLFVLDANGVPSVAKMVRVNIADTPNPAITPTLTNPGDQAGGQGAPLSLALGASDPNGDPLGYGAVGLPPGLAINPLTGVISGTPTTVGTFNVVVAVSDGVNSATAAFTWTISGAPPLAVTIPLAPSATPTGGSVSFTAAASNGLNTLFRWDFGDGTPQTAWSSSPSASHTYTQPGLYLVTVTAVDDRGIEQRQSVLQPIHLPIAAGTPSASSNIAVETRSGGLSARIWVVNQDNDSVSVFDAVTRARLAEITVGTAPRSLAIAANGMVWVTNKGSGSISVIDPATLAVNRTLALPRGSQPFGVATTPGGLALVVLEAGGQLLKFDTASYLQTGTLAIGANARHVSIAPGGATAYVSRFITPPQSGESGTAPLATGGAQLLTVGAAAMNLVRTVTLAHSTAPDAENQGRGVPNYLGAAAVSPDGVAAWVPSKLDNIQRGMGRDGLPLNFQNTVRAASSRVVLSTGAEDFAGRIDHDNASMASAAVFDSKGLYLFVALETSREVVVVDAHGKRELFRVETGIAPQGLALSADGLTLYVNNFMDRTVGVYDLRPLVQQGLLTAPPLATMNAVGTEKLAANVLLGKKLFYDARDTRLARDRYMSCASCHNDGGHDGRVWDLTGFGEGLRNTVNLRGRAGMGQGFLHWSGNFDEVQDFEGQIRNLAGGTGLMSNTAFATGTRSEPLGDPKAGLSVDLDALAAYLASLTSFEASPHRPSAATLTSAATEGKALFASYSCGTCHAGSAFTNSGAATLVNVGTIKPASGQRLWGTLTGIDAPTLRDVWATAPYLHDGSAATLEAAVRAHTGVTIGDADLAKLTAYLREIGADEASAPAPIASVTTWTDATTPGNPSVSDTGAVEVGVKFRVDVSGYITGIRFYKGAGNSGTHTGSLWSASGTRLATATFAGETATGWQTVSFATPVAVTANTVYVASYFAPNGGYAADYDYFAVSGVSNAPVHLLRDGESGGNGVYTYGAASSFPTSTFRASNYWVDVVFARSLAPDTTAPTVTGNLPAGGATGIGTSGSVSATFSEAIDPTTLTGATFELRSAANALVTATIGYDAASRTATLAPASPLAAATVYVATLRGGSTGVKDTAGNALAANHSWSFTTAAAGVCPCTIWPATATPATAAAADTGSVNLGVKFRADTSGWISGVRFYKGSGNTGTHVGALWSSGGTLLAQATFIGETTTGWQQVNFATPVAVTAGTVYVASYLAPVGRYAINSNQFASAGVTNGPLTALQNGVSGGNGVFAYSGSLAFPNQSWNASNYWVDVVFTTTPPADTAPPTVTARTPAAGATGIGLTSPVTATFSEAMDASTIAASTFELRDAANALVNATIGYNAATRVATLTPSAPLAASTVYTATVRGGSSGPRVMDPAGNALAANATWSFTTMAVDTTAPTVTARTPAIGATGVGTGSTVTVTFSEAMDTASIGTTTIELRGPANALVGASVGYNAATQVATLTPSGPLAASTTYTVTVKGGASEPRVKDLAGNALAANVAWSFTTAAGPACPCNVWPASAVPSNPSEASDTSSVNLGMKFRSDVAGYITGIRFYKGSGNGGTHVGALWSSSGTLLAQATFTGETATGWQQVNFATPVAITANTVYVASYLAPTGRYAGDNGYFTSAGVTNGPLTALQNGVSGGNGVYLYGSSLAFPTQTWNASNYWVDVVFATTLP